MAYRKATTDGGVGLWLSQPDQSQPQSFKNEILN